MPDALPGAGPDSDAVFIEYFVADVQPNALAVFDKDLIVFLLTTNKPLAYDLTCKGIAA